MGKGGDFEGATSWEKTRKEGVRGTKQKMILVLGCPAPFLGGGGVGVEDNSPRNQFGCLGGRGVPAEGGGYSVEGWGESVLGRGTEQGKRGRAGGVGCRLHLC